MDKSTFMHLTFCSDGVKRIKIVKCIKTKCEMDKTKKMYEKL
jgi:hypothetical protein